MKVFISWSGYRSREVAVALHDWLPEVAHFVTPFMSSVDIAKGTKPLPAIASNLLDTDHAILCLTPENLSSQWVHFEGGAVSVKFDGRLWTYLLGLNFEDVTGPLREYQHTLATKDETKVLVRNIHAIHASALDTARVDKAFENSWPALEAKLRAIPSRGSLLGAAAISTPKSGQDVAPPKFVMTGTYQGKEATHWLLSKKGDQYWPHTRVTFNSTSKTWKHEVGLPSSSEKVTQIIAWTSPQMDVVLGSWKKKCETTKRWDTPLQLKPSRADFIELDSRMVNVIAPAKPK